MPGNRLLDSVCESIGKAFYLFILCTHIDHAHSHCQSAGWMTQLCRPEAGHSVAACFYLYSDNVLSACRSTTPNGNAPRYTLITEPVYHSWHEIKKIIKYAIYRNPSCMKHS